MATTEPNQDTTAEAVAAPQTSGETQGAPVGTELAVEPQEPVDVPSGDELTAALKKARKEAADRRVAAREAQEQAEQFRAELEATTNRLTVMQDRWLAEKLYSTGVGIDAFRAAGHGHDLFTPDGAIDADRFAAAVEDTASRFGRTHAPSGVVPTSGIGETRVSAEPSWAAVLNKK